MLHQLGSHTVAACADHITHHYMDHIMGWFSMSPLPRLHHHDIMTIVELFFIYVPFVLSRQQWLVAE